MILKFKGVYATKLNELLAYICGGENKLEGKGMGKQVVSLKSVNPDGGMSDMFLVDLEVLERHDGKVVDSKFLMDVHSILVGS